MKFNKSKCQNFHLGWGNPGCMYRLGNEKLARSLAERDMGILVISKLNMSQQCPGSQEDQLCPGSTRHSIASQSREGIVPLCSALVWLHLECCVQFWVPQQRKDVKLLEGVQRRAMQVVKGLEGKSYEEQLRALGLFSLEKTRLKRDGEETS
ncbi:hypothetical protein WISP_82417 [Willisornis vidua]|uniref:Uncharacterized protein n=1 Tax=Willisornis vidua TaxID=1566151 RepID=A0ABQ9D9Z8_9PASS|nr:hypothetical protein WISP_82417 [Willisornis vidua]